MRHLNRKHGAFAVVVALAIPLAVAAAAFACGSLATLKLNRATARAGTEVSARGGNFNTSPRASTVQLRFNGRNGRVLWEGRPAASGRFDATFEMPSARPGYYVIVATQTGPDGRPAAGTPGRAPLRMKRARRSQRSSSALAPAPWSAPPGGSGRAAPQGSPVAPLTLAGIGALALTLLGGGLALARVARRRRPTVARTLS